jgi:hypothetical protein
MCDPGTSDEDFNQIVKNCSGAVGANSLQAYWEEENCPIKYSQLLNTDSNGSLTYNSDGQQKAQNCVQELFTTYLSTYSLTDNIFSSEYSTFQNTLNALCVNDTLPGICEKSLINYCANVSRQDALNSTVQTNFCGCYVPPDPIYLQYTEPPAGGNPACDPLCHRALTSQKADSSTGVLALCPQNICVINNTVVNTANSSINEGINFNSVCSGCGSNDPCLCIISGTNLSDTLSNIGVGTGSTPGGGNFNLLCGDDSICIVQDSNGNIISQGKCSANQNLTVPGYSTMPNWYVIAFFFFLFFVFLILFIIYKIYSGAE